MRWSDHHMSCVSHGPKRAIPLRPATPQQESEQSAYVAPFLFSSAPTPNHDQLRRTRPSPIQTNSALIRVTWAAQCAMSVDVSSSTGHLALGTVNTRMQPAPICGGSKPFPWSRGFDSWGDSESVTLADSSGGLLPIFDGDHQPVPDDLGRHSLKARSHEHIDSTGSVRSI